MIILLCGRRRVRPGTIRPVPTIRCGLAGFHPNRRELADLAAREDWDRAHLERELTTRFAARHYTRRPPIGVESVIDCGRVVIGVLNAISPVNEHVGAVEVDNTTCGH
jgi:hypothetical protein